MNRDRLRYFSGIIIATLLLACNGNNPGRSGTIAGTADPANDAFMKEASEDHMIALELGRYASGQASDQRLKNYGRYMATFHKTALEHIRTMAMTKGIVLNDTMNTGYQNLISGLIGKGGNFFDSSYMAVMIQQEKRMINNADRAAKRTEDDDIRRFAGSQKDSMFHHLDRIITLRDSINSSKEQ